MKALLDLDILPYELGSVLGEDISTYRVEQYVDKKIEGIIRSSGATEYKGFLTDSKTNFRIPVATVSTYKGHRTKEKPHHWHYIRDYMMCNYDVDMVVGYEADDFIGEECKKDIERTIICTRDKDLDTVPGWHYRWACGEKQPERKYYLSDKQAMEFFYYQLLVGDMADNIKGVLGIGKKKAETILGDCETEEENFLACQRTYIQVYGGGEDRPILYQTEQGEWVRKCPTELMAEMADLLYIGVDRSYIKRWFNGQLTSG